MSRNSYLKGESLVLEENASPEEQRTPDHRRSRLLLAVTAFLLALVLIAAYLWWPTQARRAERSRRTFEQGVSSFESGEFEKAVAELEEAVEQDPNNSRAYLLLGRGYEGRGDLEQAEKAYKKTLDIDADQPEVLYYLAVIHKYLGETEEAVSELEQAKALRDGFIGARLLLADLYASEGRVDEALAEYKSLIELKPLGLDLEMVQQKIEDLEKRE